jgi:hypothetical protein
VGVKRLPVEITIEMFAEKPVMMPFFTGHVARGLLLHFIRLVDPAASGLLHELNVSKPYSVTPLRFKSSSRTENGYVLDPPVSLQSRLPIPKRRILNLPA